MGRTLRIDKLIITGITYQRTLHFDSSLNIIKGDGYSGKSLVLRLIDFCLGSNDTIDLTVQKELASYCDEIFIEITIENNVYTFNRSLKFKPNEVRIYLCNFNSHKEYSPWKKNIDEVSQFIAQELGINLHAILKKKAGSKDLVSENISFRDFMRFIYIKQGELGTNNFLENKNPFVSRKNKEIFKIINDLIIPDLEDIQNQLRMKQNEYNKIEKINEGLLSYLNNRNALNESEIDKERNKLDFEIGITKEKKKQLVNNSATDEKDIYRQLKSDISDIDAKIDSLNIHKRNTSLSIKNKEMLLQDYHNELDEMYATLEAMKKIKIIEQKNKCPLCDSLIANDIQDNIFDIDFDDVENVCTQLKKKIAGLEKTIINENEKVREIENEIEILTGKLLIFSNALDEYKKNIELPNLSEIETYNSLIRDLQNEKNKLNSLIEMHNEINKNTITLNRLKDDISKLEKQKNTLTKLSNREADVLYYLSAHYRNTMKRFLFSNTNIDETFISDKDYMPYYSGASVSHHTSGGLLICMQIAYLGAIIEHSSKDDEHCNHPRILMLDTVSNNIGTNKDETDSLDPATYAELYKYLLNLSEITQLFIIDNTPPKIEKNHKCYSFHRENMRGLVDLEKNEYIPECRQ